MSVGQLVREGLDLEQRDWSEACRRGFAAGREEARGEYAVTVLCVCGHIFPVVGEDRIREVEDILRAHCSWYHNGCRPEEVPESECRLFRDRKCSTSERLWTADQGAVDAESGRTTGMHATLHFHRALPRLL